MKNTYPLSKGSFNGKLSEEIVAFVNSYSFAGTSAASAENAAPTGNTAEIPIPPQREAPASPETVVLTRPPLQPQPTPQPARPAYTPQPAPAPTSASSKFKPAVIAGLVGLIAVGAIVLTVVLKNKDGSVKTDKGSSESKPSVTRESEEESQQDVKTPDSKLPDPDTVPPEEPEESEDGGSDNAAPDDSEYTVPESQDESSGDNGNEEHTIPSASVPDLTSEADDSGSYTEPNENEPPHIYCIGENGNDFGTTTILRLVEDEEYDGRVFFAINNNVYYYELYSDGSWYLTDEGGGKAFQYRYQTGNYESLYNDSTAAMQKNSDSETDSEDSSDISYDEDIDGGYDG